MDFSKIQRYRAPVPFDQFPYYTIFLGGTGLLVLAYFTLLQVRSQKAGIAHEFFTALVTSGLLGFGSLFLLLWVGIYV